MKSSSSLIWLGKEKEKEIIKLCEEHMNKLIATIIGLKKTVYAFCESDATKMKSAFKEVADRESEADEIKRKVIEKLSKGIFHPINREEIIRLILTADDIATNAEAATRRLRLIPLGKINKDLKAGLKTMSDSLVDIVESVSNALRMLTQNPSDAIKLANEAEMIEESIDDFRMNQLVPKLIAWINRSKTVGFCVMLKETIDRMENIADRCEDVADVIRSIVISYA
ncbi:hypothetical protein ES706_00455 [subsurface metagenome]|nr:DUF47 family protein [Hadesarchaea archaeon]